MSDTLSQYTIKAYEEAISRRELSMTEKDNRIAQLESTIRKFLDTDENWSSNCDQYPDSMQQLRDLREQLK